MECTKTVTGYFLLGDSLNTTVTVIATLQNSVVAYDTLTLTYILIVGIAAQAVGIYTFWWIQQRFRLSTKTMFNAVMIGIILLYVLKVCSARNKHSLADNFFFTATDGA